MHSTGSEVQSCRISSVLNAIWRGQGARILLWLQQHFQCLSSQRVMTACALQSGQDRLPFLEGLAALTSRLPAKEAAAMAQHLQNAAAPLKPVKTSRALPDVMPLYLPLYQFSPIGHPLLCKSFSSCSPQNGGIVPLL